MPTQVVRSGASGSVISRGGTATATKVATRTNATSHDAKNVKYIYVTERYIEYLEEDLIYGLNILVINNNGDTRIIIPDSVDYKMTIQIENNSDYDVFVYSGYEGI